MMLTVNVKDAKAKLSSIVNEAINGEFVTITRHGKPVAALVSIEVAEKARKAMEPKRMRLVDYLRTFPGDDAFERNRTPSRDIEI
ncbi:type II toxin-antitoxin system Phd/YefM family antitoxin [Acidithiobacillus sp. M4-SHS-6]|uniref:type II toxin-antitoxin system Phd/YefM family antitoxin n=1 Tax=Acidithiobacillus sp. M4-SHS-6 TaxID=3383024 RepID=UPI0039BE2006